MVQQEWWFHRDNAPVHTAKVVQDWFTAHKIQQLEHPPYSPELAPGDFFLFRRIKEELAVRSLDKGSLKKTWEGVTRNIAANEFATPSCSGVSVIKCVCKSSVATWRK
jgi:hypothetical protein